MVEEELLDAEDELKAKLGGETKAKDQENKTWTSGDAWIQAFLLLDQRQGKDEGANVKDDQTDQRKKKFFCTWRFPYNVFVPLSNQDLAQFRQRICHVLPQDERDDVVKVAAPVDQACHPKNKLVCVDVIFPVHSFVHVQSQAFIFSIDQSTEVEHQGGNNQGGIEEKELEKRFE